MKRSDNLNDRKWNRADLFWVKVERSLNAHTEPERTSTLSGMIRGAKRVAEGCSNFGVTIVGAADGVEEVTDVRTGRLLEGNNGVGRRGHDDE